MTCSPLVGLGFPEILALGAAIYTPEVLINCAATGWLGIRMATVPSPPVMDFGTQSLFFKIMVSGPGQNFSARSFACAVTSQESSSSAFVSAICTISGLSDGLPFAA